MHLPIRSRTISIFISLAFLLLTRAVGQQRDGAYVRTSSPALYSHDELLHLGNSATGTKALEHKLHALVTTPTISNEA
jgi:hypothetical protein